VTPHSALRIAHITDTHITDGHRLEDQAQALLAAVERAEAEGVSAWLLTGDFYGRTVPHRSTPAERLVLFPAVSRMAETGPVVIVYGNHDYPGDLDIFESLSSDYGWPVIVVSRSTSKRLATPAGVPLHVHGFPFPAKTWALAGDDAPRGIEAGTAAVSSKLDMLVGLSARSIQRARRREPTAAHVFVGHLTVGGSRLAGGERILQGLGHLLRGKRHALTHGDIRRFVIDTQCN